jgi:hypothetical protein
MPRKYHPTEYRDYFGREIKPCTTCGAPSSFHGATECTNCHEVERRFAQYIDGGPRAVKFITDALAAAGWVGKAKAAHPATACALGAVDVVEDAARTTAGKKVSTFEIREVDSLGVLLKSVEADNAFRAIELAFPGKEFHRETGWGGGSGTWKVKGKAAHVWVGPAVAAPTKPKAKPKAKVK